MTSFLISVSLLIFSLNSYARGLSAHRSPDAHYNHSRFIPAALDLESSSAPSLPEDLQVSLSQLDVSKVPELTDSAALTAGFNYVRDTRFIKPDDSDFIRRITWLYPDDGCYARAELMSQIIQDNHFPPPVKIFAFGDLQVNTVNSPSGSVTWWYHVTIAYKHAGQIYVFDPAIEPQQPLSLKEWGLRMGMNQTDIKFAICSAKTFDPDSDCLHPQGLTRTEALEQQSEFLPAEWERVQELGRKPEVDLGDQPPWLSHLKF